MGRTPGAGGRERRAGGTLRRMVRVRRVPRGLVVPALLVALVAALATLQYRWLGKVSEAEREQLRRSLDQRAREFADEFDAEISRAYLALHLSQPEVAAGDWERFAVAVDRWRNAARFPSMIRDIYLIEAKGKSGSARRYDRSARSFRSRSGRVACPPREVPRAPASPARAPRWRSPASHLPASASRSTRWSPTRRRCWCRLARPLRSPAPRLPPRGTTGGEAPRFGRR